MKETLRKIGRLALPVLAAAFYLYIAFCVPYCHDDWDWGLDVGLRQWLHAEVNSRYVGNFFVVVMTRSEVVKTPVMAGCFFSVPLLVTWLAAGRYDTKTFLLSNLLLLTVPQKLWQQTYGWVSAFANFVVSAAAVLWLLRILLRGLDTPKEENRLRVLRLAGVLLLSAACGLFYESLSVYLFIVSLFGLCLCIPRKRRYAAPELAACVLGAGAGLAVILSNALFGELLSSGQALGGIRSLSFEVGSGFFALLQAVAGRYFGTILPGLTGVHPVLTGFTAVSAIVGTLTAKRKAGVSVFLSLLTAACAVPLLFPIGEALRPYAVGAELLCWAVSALLQREQAGRKLFILLSAALVLAPLAVTPELGPRLYYLPCVLLAVFALSLLPEVNAKGVTGFLLLLLALAMVFYIFIYSEIRSVTVARAEAIRTAVESGADSVTLPRDPYKYWWGRNPTAESRVGYFKEFYGIPPEMEVIFE